MPSLPPKYTNQPIGILYDLSIPPEIRDTWAQLYGLAYKTHRAEEPVTPPLTIEEITALTGKKRSTLYGHLAFLRDSDKLRFESAGDGILRVYFTNVKRFFSSEILDKSNIAFSFSSLNQVNDSKDSEIKELNSGVQNSGQVNQARRKPVANPKPSTRDPRTDHPAIQCVKGITSRYPQKELYDDLIRTVGDKPDIEKLLACRKEWLKRGYNPNALTWALEWYKTGIPDRFSKNGKTHQQVDWIKEMGGAKRVKALFENGNLSEYEIGAHRQELISIGINPDDYVFEEDTDAVA